MHAAFLSARRPVLALRPEQHFLTTAEFDPLYLGIGTLPPCVGVNVGVGVENNGNDNIGWSSDKAP